MPFDILVKQNATVDDTLRLIVTAANNASRSPFVQQIVSELHLSDQVKSPFADVQNEFRNEKLKRLFNYICRNAKYQLDIPGIEEVWTPEKVIREGKFDCKKVSVLISSVLKAAGIESLLKHVYYRGPDGSLENFTHIYVIVPNPDLNNYITVDPTNNCEYNKEVQHSKATLYNLDGKKMELHMMGKAPGTPAPAVNADGFQAHVNQAACKVEDQMRAICGMPGSAVCGPADYVVDYIGLKAKDSSGNVLFEHTAGEAAAHIAAIPVMFASRAAFLGLLYLGKLLAKTPIKIHMATRLAKAWQINKSKLRKMWWLLGGTKDAKALQTAIIKGSGISISGPYGYGYDYPGLYRKGMNGTSIGEPVTLATATAAIAVALPVIAAAKGIMKALGVYKDGDTDPEPPANEPPPPPPPTPPGPTPPGPTPPGAASILDMSSPVNTIVKAVFFIGISGMISGVNFYVLNTLCAAAIVFSVAKIFIRK